MYRIFFIVLILFSCGEQNKKESAEFFERANYHFKKNELERAIELYDESIKKTPDFADAYHNKALVLLAMDKPQEAIKMFQEAIKIDPDFYQAKFNLAKTYSEIGDYQQSESLFAQIEPQYRDSSNFYYYTGINEFQKNEFKNAEFDFVKSLKLDSNNELSINALGVLAFKQHQYDKAKEYFEKVLKINPQNYVAMSNLGLSDLHLNNKNEALKSTKKAYNSQLNNVDFYNNLVYVYLETDSLNQAKTLLDLKIDDNAYYYRNLGIYYFKIGDKTKATEYFKKAKDLDSNTEGLEKYLELIKN